MSTTPLHTTTLKARHATDPPCCCLDEKGPISISELTESLSINNNPVQHFNLIHSLRRKINPLSLSAPRIDTHRQGTILSHPPSQMIITKNASIWLTTLEADFKPPM